MTLYLTADAINGVMIIPVNPNQAIEEAIGVKNLTLTKLREEVFYETLGEMTLSDEAIYSSGVSLSMAKKIHREYGLTRY